jgi:hypothetical protein
MQRDHGHALVREYVLHVLARDVLVMQHRNHSLRIIIIVLIARRAAMRGGM